MSAKIIKDLVDAIFYMSKEGRYKRDEQALKEALIAFADEIKRGAIEP